MRIFKINLSSKKHRQTFPAPKQFDKINILRYPFTPNKPLTLRSILIVLSTINGGFKMTLSLHEQALNSVTF